MNRNCQRAAGSGRGETDNTCTRIEEVEHSYSNERITNCVPSQQDSRAANKKGAVGVAVYNTSKCLAHEATWRCCKSKKQGQYQSVCRSVTSLAAL